MSIESEADEDLRDVFRLLYSEDNADDWAFSDDEEVPRDNSRAAGGEKAAAPEEDLMSISKRYTKKRFFDALDTLVTPPTAKKARIYPTSISQSLAQNTYIPSTSPLPLLPPITLYAPYSPLPLLVRLRTYAAFSFPEYESPIDPVNLSKGGWACAGRTRVECGVCRRQVDFTSLGEIKNGEVRKEVARRLGNAMRDRHGSDCPWRVKQSPDDLLSRLRKTIHPPLSSSLTALAEGIQRDCMGTQFQWTSPLTSEQSSALQDNLSRHDQSISSDAVTHTSPSILAYQMALFGWYPYHPNGTSSHIDPFPSSSSSSTRTEIVHCRACQRRIGLWAFKSSTQADTSSEGTPPKSFDLLNEHLTWCPIREGSWWSESPLVKSQEKRASDVGAKKGWVTISDKVERKKWRK